MNDDFVPNSGIARAPSKTIPRTEHDHLPLPGGRKVGEVPSAELLRILAANNVAGVSAEHGRSKNIDLYALHVQRIRSEGATLALDTWLAAGRAC